MKKSMAFAGLLATACMSLSLLSPSQAQQGPKVVQRSLTLSTNDQGRFWPDPKKEPIYGKAAWIPNRLGMSFLVVGPVTSGSQFSLEFLKPDGKPWVSVNCRTPELEAGEVDEIKGCDDIPETMAQPAVGFVPIQIRLKNELEGVNAILYKGRLKVTTYLDKYKKQTQHVTDEDWRVPMAFVTVDQGNDESNPPLIAYFWFKSRSLTGSDLIAQLNYNGKQIALSSDLGGSAHQVIEQTQNLEPLDPKQDHSYQLYNFYFSKVRGWVHKGQNYDVKSWHQLDKNPGNYEIKVLYKGQLVRQATFSVGSDGKITAPGSVEKDGAGNDRILIPTKVLGSLDGVWDRAAYKTEIYYGNPGPQTSGILAP